MRSDECFGVTVKSLGMLLRGNVSPKEVSTRLEPSPLVCPSS